MLIDTRESKGGLLSNLALHAGTYYTYLQVLVLYSSTGVYSGAIVLRYYLFRGLQLRVEFKLCSFPVLVSGVRLCAYGERYAEDLILVLYAQYCAHSRVRKVPIPLPPDLGNASLALSFSTIRL